MPFFAAALLLGMLHLGIAREAGVVAPATGSFGARLIGAGAAFMLYLVHTVCPIRLSPIYELPGSLFLGLAGLALMLGLTVLAFERIVLARSAAGRAVGYGIGIFLIALLPVNTIFPATSVTVADRYLYLAVIGLAVVVTEAVRQARVRTSRVLVTGLAALVLVALGLTTVMQNRVWRDSITLWTRAAEIAPGHPLVWIKLGESERQVGIDTTETDVRRESFARAVRAFARAVELAGSPHSEHRLQAEERLGATQLLSGDGAAAVATYDALITQVERLRNRPDARPELARFAANAHRNRGKAREQMGDLEGAMADFARSAELEPESVASHYDLGTLLGALAGQGHEKGDFDAAIRELEKAIELDPGFLLAYDQLGILSRARGDLVGAVRAYERWIAVDPKSVEARLALARLYLQERQIDAAEEVSRKAAEADPRDPRPYLFLAQIALARGDLDGAEVQFNKAGTVAPGLPQVNAGLATVRLERSLRAENQKDIAQALREARAGQALAPRDPAIGLRIAKLLEKDQARPEAAEAYRGLLETFPDNADISRAAAFFYKDLGWYHLLRENEDEEAIRSFQLAVELLPEEPDFDAIRGILRNRGRLPPAAAPADDGTAGARDG